MTALLAGLSRQLIRTPLRLNHGVCHPDDIELVFVCLLAISVAMCPASNPRTCAGYCVPLSSPIHINENCKKTRHQQYPHEYETTSIRSARFET